MPGKTPISRANQSHKTTNVHAEARTWPKVTKLDSSPQSMRSMILRTPDSDSGKPAASTPPHLMCANSTHLKTSSGAVGPFRISH